MQANELRIGNWVYRANGKNGNKDIEYQIENINLQSVKKYEPIPLTEEILLKAGFDGLQSPNDKIIIGRVDDDFIKDQMTFLFDKKIILKIQYLHQLQNLYFALTQKELEIVW